MIVVLVKIYFYGFILGSFLVSVNLIIGLFSFNIGKKILNINFYDGDLVLLFLYSK